MTRGTRSFLRGISFRKRLRESFAFTASNFVTLLEQIIINMVFIRVSTAGFVFMIHGLIWKSAASLYIDIDKDYLS